MHGLAADELLTVWERGRTLSPVGRALAVLAAVAPGMTSEALLALAIGQRDRRLFDVRSSTFGYGLTATAACPHCAAEIETAFDTRALLRSPVSDEAQELCVLANEYEVRFRLPTSHDQVRIAALANAPDTVASVLLRCCVLSATRRGVPVDCDELPGGVIDAVAARMSAADPYGDIQLRLQCPNCGDCWDAALDIGSFFWRELDSYARRLLREVHMLASAYGWREAEILALNPSRRQMYLELVAT